QFAIPRVVALLCEEWIVNDAGQRLIVLRECARKPFERSIPVSKPGKDFRDAKGLRLAVTGDQLIERPSRALFVPQGMFHHRRHCPSIIRLCGAQIGLPRLRIVLEEQIDAEVEARELVLGTDLESARQNPATLRALSGGIEIAAEETQRGREERVEL